MRDLRLGMVIELTTEQEARLREIAGKSGQSAEDFVAEAALLRLQSEAFDAEIIRQRLERADTTALIEEDEMDRRFQSMLRSR